MKKRDMAIDLGTTNTVVACWDSRIDGPEIVNLEGICRGTLGERDIDDSYTIPSCLYLVPPEEALPFPFKYLFKNLRSKTRALIGMEAIAKDGGLFTPGFVQNFKSHLGRNSFQIIGKLGKWSYTADDIALIFLKALFSRIKKDKKEIPAEVTFCVPVDFYEFYRAKLLRIAGHLRAKRVRTIDEPVAAALGYGLGVNERKNILVIDFGAGTLDLALIQTEEKTSERGRCRVIAKEGAPVGGNLVDAWIVEELCGHYSYSFDRLSTDPGIQWWYKVLLGEACRLKENLFFNESDTFYLMPSTLMKNLTVSVPGNRADLKKPMDFTREGLVALLGKKGLYSMLSNLIASVVRSAGEKGISDKMIDDVVMVGGSTLLPQVYALVEKKFGRDRVRAWQPFNAVAFGAAAFATGRIQKSDHITHDYAFVTYDKKTLEQEYNIIIPQGTPFPTPRDFWKRQLAPTCALGEPERIFKLIICEIGRRHSFDQEFVWDDKGDLHLLKDDDGNQSLVIPLNESDPTLGYLSPPHFPSDKGARIELSFMINEDRWLCASVFDLKTGKMLLTERPVIRLK